MVTRAPPGPFGRLGALEPAQTSVLLVLAAGLIWSLQGLMIRSIETAGTAEVVYWRGLGQLAGMLLVVAVVSRGRILTAFRHGGRLACLGGAFSAAAGLSFVYALAYLSVANVVFMFAAAPLFAALGGWLLLGERLRRDTLIAMGLVLVGIGLMAWQGLSTGRAVGFVFALITTVAFAAMALVGRLGGGTRMLPLGVWAGAINVCVMSVLAPNPWSVSAHDAVIAMASGGVLTAGGVACFMIGARHVPAGVLPFLTFTEIVFAPIWVWLVFAEVPSVATLIGGNIVLGAIIYEAYRRFADETARS